MSKGGVAAQPDPVHLLLTMKNLVNIRSRSSSSLDVKKLIYTTCRAVASGIRLRTMCCYDIYSNACPATDVCCHITAEGLISSQKKVFLWPQMCFLQARTIINIYLSNSIFSMYECEICTMLYNTEGCSPCWISKNQVLWTVLYFMVSFRASVSFSKRRRDLRVAPIGLYQRQRLVDLLLSNGGISSVHLMLQESKRVYEFEVLVGRGSSENRSQGQGSNYPLTARYQK